MVFVRFVSRLCLLHTCVLELLTLPVLRACPLPEAFGDSHIAISAFATLIVLRACLLPEALGRSHIGILDLTTLTHLVRVDLRHSRSIRASPLRAPLLTLVAEPFPGGSIWTSLWVPIWSLFSCRPLPPCPAVPPSPPAPQNLGIDTLSRKYHFSIQTLLNNDHLGAWLASGPYLPPGIPVASWGMFCVCLYCASAAVETFKRLYLDPQTRRRICKEALVETLG